MARRESPLAAGSTEQTILAVWLQPGAARDGLVGWREGVLRVRVSAPPVDGKANLTLTRFLAATLGIAPGDVIVTRGQTSRRKLVSIAGLGPDEVRARLSAAM